MTDDDALCALDAASLVRLVVRREVSREAVMRAHLARIGRLDAAVHAFVELRPDGRRVLELLAQKGSLGALLEGIDPGDLPAIENVRRFAGELHRLGVLAPRA